MSPARGSRRRFDRRGAARIAIEAQGLHRPSARADRRHLRRAMACMRVLQLDSIPVIARTQYLVLRSRAGDYPAPLLDRMAYRDREWIETWAHEASLVPMALEPLFRWRHERSRRGQTWAPLVRFAKENPGFVGEVLAQVKARGPLCAADLEDPRRRTGAWWASRSGGSLALDWLFRIGEVGILRDERFQKSFDLLERITGPEVAARPTPPEPDAHRQLLREAAAALGVATSQDLAAYFRLSMKDVRPRIAELRDEGTLLEAEIPGWPRPTWVHRDSRRPRRCEGRALLSPFDPLVWHRDRTRRLFGFDYRIEIYVPAEKRVHGYYVLPFLLDGDLAARVDGKSDRRTGHLRVLGAWLEPGRDEARVAAELARELTGLAVWLGLEQGVEIGRRGNLARALRSAVRGH